MRPYIICHMVASVDGRIDCSMVDKISGDEYYSALESLDCPSSVEGKVTTEHYHSLPGRYKAADNTPIGRETHYKAVAADGYQICPDTNGTLLWDADLPKPLLIMLSENAPAEYLDYLRDRNISYIVAGRERIDLNRAMEILGDEFGVERLAVVGGGKINGGFLSAGLIDELSLLLAPGIDGRTSQPALFDGIADGPGFLPARLVLKSVGTVADGVLWIKYSVVRD